MEDYSTITAGHSEPWVRGFWDGRRGEAPSSGPWAATDNRSYLNGYDKGKHMRRFEGLGTDPDWVRVEEEGDAAPRPSFFDDVRQLLEDSSMGSGMIDRAVGRVHELFTPKPRDELKAFLRDAGINSVRLNLNDTFGYATADAMDVYVEDEDGDGSNVDKLVDMWREYGQAGLIAFAAKARRRAPLRELRSDAYHAAIGSLVGWAYEDPDDDTLD